MKQQTAVDFLIKKFHDYGTLYYSDIAEAKEMEKEQIIEAVMYGDIRGKLEKYMTAEEYYNETYNK